LVLTSLTSLATPKLPEPMSLITSYRSIESQDQRGGAAPRASRAAAGDEEDEGVGWRLGAWARVVVPWWWWWWETENGAEVGYREGVEAELSLRWAARRKRRAPVLRPCVAAVAVRGCPAGRSPSKAGP
jgi:hypothetical protein